MAVAVLPPATLPQLTVMPGETTVAFVVNFPDVAEYVRLVVVPKSITVPDTFELQVIVLEPSVRVRVFEFEDENVPQVTAKLFVFKDPAVSVIFLAGVADPNVNAEFNVQPPDVELNMRFLGRTTPLVVIVLPVAVARNQTSFVALSPTVIPLASVKFPYILNPLIPVDMLPVNVENDKFRK